MNGKDVDTKDKTTKGDKKSNSVAPQNRGYRLIKKRSETVVMPEANYDSAFDKENPYYIKIANKYRILKYVTSLLAIVFAIVMLTAFSSDITAENFQYLIKDLDITGITSGTTFDSVIYNGGTSASFGIYRGELVVVNAGTTMLYKPSGALSFNKTNKFYNPRVEISSKYFLVYDRGETSYSYSIFNSFAELKSERYEYPITLATLSDIGSYAVVTRDDSYRSIIKVYNENFKQVSEIKKEKYVTDLSFTSDGELLAIASVYDKDGAFDGEISVIKPGSSKPDFTVSVSGLLPLNVKWLSNGSLCVVYPNAVHTYSKSGEKLTELLLTNLLSLRVSAGEQLILAVHNTNVLGYDKTVKIYDTNSELLFSTSLQGELIKALSYENKSRRQTASSISRALSRRGLISSGRTKVVEIWVSRDAAAAPAAP